MRIRAERAGEAQAIHDLTAAAFGQEAEAQLVDMLRTDGDAELSLVAEEAGQVVGHVLLSPMAAPKKVLGLGPISVLPDRQRQGIGGALIAAAAERAQAAGWSAIFLLGDPNYYARHGFSVDLAAGFDNPYAGPYFMARELVPGALSRTFAVDYAPAFARMED